MAQCKIGAPLFIVRELAGADLFGVLEKIAEIGYDGVEFLGFFGKKPGEIRKKLDSLGLAAIGNHVGLDEFYRDPAKTVGEHRELGCKYITVAWPNADITCDMPEFGAAAAKVRELCEICRANGLTPLYHNHGFDFATAPSLLQALMDACRAEGLCLEPDLGWMAYCSVDPVEYLVKYRDSSPVIHLKDIYARDFSKIGPRVSHGDARNSAATGYFEFRPTGYGTVNFARLLPYCLDCNPEWLVADHDLAYGRDSFCDLKLSRDYIATLLAIHG